MTDFYQKQGTAKTIKASSGDATITLTSLANTAARESTQLDLGENFGREYGYRMDSKWAVAPTTGTLLRLFLAFSNDGAAWPGGVAETDQAYGDVDDLRNLIEITPLVADADTNAQAVVNSFRPLARYMCLVVYNDATGQALSSTAGDHVLTCWPLIDTTA
jgi:hypothetical protein